MDEHRLALQRLHERGLERVHEERAHRAVHLQVVRRHGRAGLRVRHDNASEASAQVLQVRRHREDRHHLRGDGDVEAGAAGEAVEPAAAPDLEVAQALRAEVHRPAELNAVRVDVEALQAARGEPGVVVVALVLHAAVERDHRKVVRVRDRVDVAREAERERRERHDLGEAAAGGAALDVEGGPARRLAHAADDLLAETAEALHEAERRRRLALAERGRRDGRHVDVLRALPSV